MQSDADEKRDSGAAVELTVGCVAVIAVAFTAVALFGPAQYAGRAVVMAVAAGILAAVTRDWRAWLAVTAFAALVFVGFLAHRAGQLSGDPTPWRYTLVIGFAAVLGHVRPWVRNAVRLGAARTSGPPRIRSTRPETPASVRS
jgi:hypothetical protein